MKPIEPSRELELEQRILDLEEALAEYISKYGFTERSRALLISSEN